MTLLLSTGCYIIWLQLYVACTVNYGYPPPLHATWYCCFPQMWHVKRYCCSPYIWHDVKWYCCSSRRFDMLDGTVLSTGVVICRTQAVIRWWWIVLVYPAHKIYIRLVKFVLSLFGWGCLFGFSGRTGSCRCSATQDAPTSPRHIPQSQTVLSGDSTSTSLHNT